MEGRKKTREKGKEAEYERRKRLLEGFPNLKIGGLLPDPDASKEKGTPVESLESTVVVFSTGARLLEEGDSARLLFQPPTTGGRLGQTPLLWDNMHGPKCSNEEAH